MRLHVKHDATSHIRTTTETRIDTMSSPRDIGISGYQEIGEILESYTISIPRSSRSVTYGADRSHIEYSSGSSSGVHRFQRKMRDVDAYVVWYLSEGPEPLSRPHSSTGANPGDLFIHRPVRGEEGQIWVVGKDGIWGKIAIGGKHPLLSGYRLHLLANRDPGWVTKKTATTYRGRQKRQANAVSNLSFKLHSNIC